VDVYQGLLANRVVTVTGAGLGGLELRGLLARTGETGQFPAPPTARDANVLPAMVDRIIGTQSELIVRAAFDTETTISAPGDFQTDYVKTLAVQALRAESGYRRLERWHGRPADTVIVGGFAQNSLYLAIRQSLAGESRRVLRSTVTYQAAHTAARLALLGVCGAGVPAIELGGPDGLHLEPSPRLPLPAAAALAERLP
jgi:hypothetical protein